ncbi:hypothetical protein Gain_0168_001 [Komagataeibacter intermedius TF2]|nr:hypothetical protein Gain_0168_001 [Komagataeibacter intermedius TF2]
MCQKCIPDILVEKYPTTEPQRAERKKRIKAHSKGGNPSKDFDVVSKRKNK